MMTLSQVKAEVDRLARLIGASEDILPTYGHSEDFARPHIEVDAKGYHYVVVERGVTLERTTTQDISDLLYRVFRSVTAELALRYISAHKVEGQDQRRLAFQHETELLSTLSSEWADRYSREVAQILKEHPFDDLGSARAVLTKNLRDQGHAPDDARRIARERYPLPKQRQQ